MFISCVSSDVLTIIGEIAYTLIFWYTKYSGLQECSFKFMDMINFDRVFEYSLNIGQSLSDLFIDPLAKSSTMSVSHMIW